MFASVPDGDSLAACWGRRVEIIDFLDCRFRSSHNKDRRSFVTNDIGIDPKQHRANTERSAPGIMPS